MNPGLDTFWLAVAAGTIRSGTPVLYAALGEVITQRSGILNLGLEGIMLVGAWIAVVTSFHTGEPLLAIGAALISGSVLGLLHGFLCIKLGTNQVAAGVAMTILGSGLSALFGIPYVGKRIVALKPVDVPLLSQLPVVGPIFFSHDVLVYGTYILVPVLAVLMYRTKFGMAVIAAGQDPHAAEATGVRVQAVRFAATIAGSALAAVGGAYLSLVFAQGWVENMTTGRGLIAVGLVMFARWDPWRSVLGAWLFGGAIALQLRLQAVGTAISPHILAMAPYLVVATVLVISTIRLKAARAHVPAALGGFYVRQL